MNSNNSKLNGRLNASPAAHQFFHRSATAYLYTTAATSLSWEWLVVTIAKTDWGCVAIIRFFHVLYFKPCVWTYRDVCGAVLTKRVVSIPVQCGCDSYFLRSATSHTAGAGAERHCFEREFWHLPRQKVQNRVWSSFKWSKIHSNDIRFFFNRLSERNCLNIRTYKYSLKSRLNRQI